MTIEYTFNIHVFTRVTNPRTLLKFSLFFKRKQYTTRGLEIKQNKIE